MLGRPLEPLAKFTCPFKSYQSLICNRALRRDQARTQHELQVEFAVIPRRVVRQLADRLDSPVQMPNSFTIRGSIARVLASSQPIAHCLVGQPALVKMIG